MKQITVFEHQSLFTGEDSLLTQPMLTSLQKFHGKKGVPYFSLINNGVKFNEYVGVIQLKNVLIEVLPKADFDMSQKSSEDQNSWRNVLIKMLHSVGAFDIKAPTNSSLKLHHNSILELYFELFINQVEYLLHTGLIKKYRRKEANLTVLKGRINFTKNLQHNLVHAERFYVDHITYDVQHLIHTLLYKAIKTLRQINRFSKLNSRIGELILFFPEMPNIKISESVFNKIILDRKSKPYEQAIQLAKLILLRLAPINDRGNENVPALMFDMNKLWEKFVFISLRNNKDTDIIVSEQTTKNFWKPINGSYSTIRPDIVVYKDPNNCVVIDTKWKNLKGHNPAIADLRQMFVYLEYFNAQKVALVYPGNKYSDTKGVFAPPPNRSDNNKKTEQECHVVSIEVENDIKKWQDTIYKNISQLWGITPTN